MYLAMIIVKFEVGGKPENCVTFSSLKGITRTVSRDLLKVFEFCKMFQAWSPYWSPSLASLARPADGFFSSGTSDPEYNGRKHRCKHVSEGLFT